MSDADRPRAIGRRRRGGHVAARQGTSRRRWIALVTAFVLVMALSATATAGTLIWYSDHALNRITVTELRPQEAAADVNGDGAVDEAERAQIKEIEQVLNVLVVGSDSRQGLSEDELGELGTEDHGALLTDTIMLLQLDPRRDNAALLSFPRDLLVTYCNGASGRINAAYATGEETSVGGPNCLVETIHDLTDIPIHHYVAVDFAGFIDVVDALGGVSMYFEEPLTDRFAGLDVPAGCVQLDGAEALGFVRARHLDSDFGRMARQQRFLREMVEEATSAGTLLNPARVLSLITSLASTVETDDDLSLSEMRRIVFSVRNLSGDSLVMRTIPSLDRTIDGAYYVVPVEAQADALFDAFRNGAVFPPEATPSETAASEAPTPEPELNAADVAPLTVLNGAGTGGLGSETTQYLVEHGFQVAVTDNADSFTHTRTEVVYPPDLREQAEVVAEAMGGVRLTRGEAGEDLTVLIGSDFDPDAGSLPEPPDEPPVPSDDDDEPETSSTLPPEPERDFAGAQESDVRC